MRPEIALLAASGLHLGFQLVVTTVVYPALAAVPPAEWERAHAAHTRRILPAVVFVYLVVAAACLDILIAGLYTPATVIALAGHALAGLTTAVLAAPQHGRLGRDGRDATRMTALLRADRIRLNGTLIAAVAALAAVLTT